MAERVCHAGFSKSQLILRRFVEKSAGDAQIVLDTKIDELRAILSRRCCHVVEIRQSSTVNEIPQGVTFFWQFSMQSGIKIPCNKHRVRRRK